MDRESGARPHRVPEPGAIPRGPRLAHPASSSTGPASVPPEKPVPTSWRKRRREAALEGEILPTGRSDLERSAILGWRMKKRKESYRGGEHGTGGPGPGGVPVPGVHHTAAGLV